MFYFNGMTCRLCRLSVENPVFKRNVQHGRLNA